MADKTFRVCDQPDGGRGTCNERNTAPCVSCTRDFCVNHRTSEVAIDVTFFNSTAGKITRIPIGTLCGFCKLALKTDQIVELFSPAVAEILLRLRAHVAAEALKTDKKE